MNQFTIEELRNLQVIIGRTQFTGNEAAGVVTLQIKINNLLNDLQKPASREKRAVLPPEVPNDEGKRGSSNGGDRRSPIDPMGKMAKKI